MEAFIVTYGKGHYRRFDSYLQSLKFYNFIKNKYSNATFYIEKYSYLDKIIDKFLSDVNLSRVDFDIKFRFNHHQYRIRSFSMLWTILTSIYTFTVMYGIYALICITIIMFG